MNHPVLLLPILLLALWAGSVRAQNTVIQAENVRFDYAQVLRVSPVYQTLTASAVEQQCDEEREDSKLQRVVGAVKEALTPNSKDKDASGNCRPVTVEREFRRPIAYDVDYVYKGAKFRSRLPEDPGNRLRIRIAITPAVPGATSP